MSDGHNDDWNFRAGAYGATCSHATDPGHVQIEKHKITRLCVQLSQRLFARRALDYLMAVSDQAGPQGASHLRVIIDDENPLRRLADRHYGVGCHGH
jgi:hypothetical protein